MSKDNKLAVVIVGAYPLNYGQISIIDKGLEMADSVLVLVGSAFNCLFTYKERANLIKEYYTNRVHTEPLPDNLYETNQWFTDVQDLVSQYESNKTIFIGSGKYFNNFPQWEFLKLETNKDEIPEVTSKFLENPKNLVHYKNLTSKKTNVSNLVCATVIQSGHILLVQNKNLCGIPTGVVQLEEALDDIIVNILREDIKLKIPIPVLIGSIIKKKTIENLKDKTIIQSYLIQLKNNEELPKAKNAQWVSLIDFYNMETNMYSDHFHIVKRMIDNE